MPWVVYSCNVLQDSHNSPDWPQLPIFFLQHRRGPLLQVAGGVPVVPGEQTTAATAGRQSDTHHSETNTLWVLQDMVTCQKLSTTDNYLSVTTSVHWCPDLESSYHLRAKNIKLSQHVFTHENHIPHKVTQCGVVAMTTFLWYVLEAVEILKKLMEPVSGLINPNTCRGKMRSGEQSLGVFHWNKSYCESTCKNLSHAIFLTLIY